VARATGWLRSTGAGRAGHGASCTSMWMPTPDRSPRPP
jgi:hypothetical protein